MQLLIVVANYMKSTFLFLFLSANVIVNGQGLSLPYVSGFDSAPETAGWQQFRLGNDPGAFQWNIGGGGFSSMCLSHDYNVGGNTTDTVIDWFVSPALNFVSTGSISLKVKTSGFSTPTVDNCEVYFGTNDQDPATGNFVLIGTLSYMSPQFNWIDTTLSIPFTSDSGYVAFRYKTIGAAWMTYAIDNINIISTASVDETSSQNNFIQVYPNPMQETSTLFIESDLSYSGVIRIYDIYGKEIQTINSISNQINLSRENFSSGIYIVVFENEGEILEVEKLVVN